MKRGSIFEVLNGSIGQIYYQSPLIWLHAMTQSVSAMICLGSDRQLKLVANIFQAGHDCCLSWLLSDDAADKMTRAQASVETREDQEAEHLITLGTDKN